MKDWPPLMPPRVTGGTRSRPPRLDTFTAPSHTVVGPSGEGSSSGVEGVGLRAGVRTLSKRRLKVATHKMGKLAKRPKSVSESRVGSLVAKAVAKAVRDQIPPLMAVGAGPVPVPVHEVPRGTLGQCPSTHGG